MTQGALRKLYFDISELQRKMDTVGERLKKLEDYDPRWSLRGKEMMGASMLLVSWMDAIDKLIEVKDD